MEKRIELKSLEELKAMLEKVKELYESMDDPNGALMLGRNGIEQKGKEKAEVSDKIRVLEMMQDLENRIRAEETKERLLNGEV